MQCTHTHQQQPLHSTYTPSAANFKLSDSILIIFLIRLKLAGFFLSMMEHRVGSTEQVIHQYQQSIAILGQLWVTAVLTSLPLPSDRFTHTLHCNLAHAYVRTYVRTYIPTIINQMWPQKHPLYVITGTSNYRYDVLQGIEAAS